MSKCFLAAAPPGKCALRSGFRGRRTSRTPPPHAILLRCVGRAPHELAQNLNWKMSGCSSRIQVDVRCAGGISREQAIKRFGLFQRGTSLA
jgi:hypothetical protein